MKLQRQTSKDEILQGYLNTIYFGRGAYGIEAAAHAYFDKDAKDLNVAEGAVLASVLNSPTALDPAGGADNKQRLLGRYQYVLNGMASAGDITAAKAERLSRKLPKFPKIERDNQYGGQKGHMLALVRKQLLAKGFTEEQISRGGLKVTTTFTQNAMRAAKQAVLDQKPKGLKQLHVAVATVDPQTGALRGMYGGQDYLKSQINWAVAGGSPGSAFKPFALTAGIEDGYSLKSTFQGNSPYTFPDGVGTVVNEGPGDGNDYGSRISLTKATQDSVNTAYADLTASMDNGPQKIMDTAVKMGIPRDAPGLKPYPGHRARLGHHQPDRHGERLRHDRRRRQGQEVVRHRQGDRQQRSSRVQGPRHHQARGAVRHRHATSATRSSRWCRAAPGRTRSRSAGRRPARPAPPPTRTATSRHRGSSGTRRSSRPP